MASTMYGTPMVSSVMPNPMGTPMMSTVMPNPMGGMIGASSTGVQGLPMSTALPIPVNENTPNLAEIQSFPVIIRGNGIHMHQDPISGQRYRMNDAFHGRIPEILANRTQTSSASRVQQTINQSISPIDLLQNKASVNQSIVSTVDLLKSSGAQSNNETAPISVTNVSDIRVYGLNNLQESSQNTTYTSYADGIIQGSTSTFVDTSNIPITVLEDTINSIVSNSDIGGSISKIDTENLTVKTRILDNNKFLSNTNDFSIPVAKNIPSSIQNTVSYPTNKFSSVIAQNFTPTSGDFSDNVLTNSFSSITITNFSNSVSDYTPATKLPVNRYIDM